MVATKNKRKRTFLKADQNKQVILYHEKFPRTSQDDIAAYFTHKFGMIVERRLVSKLVSEKQKWLQATDGTKRSDRKAMHPDLETALYKWLCSALSNQMILTDEILMSKAAEIGQKIGIDDNFKYSKGWLDNFKKCRNIKQIVLHGEASSVSPEDVEKARELLVEKLEKYQPIDIYNMDESALFYELLPSKTLSISSKSSGSKQSKKCVTIMLCCNMDGSGKRKMMIIGKFKAPRCFKNFNISHFADYRSNTKGWMVSSIFTDWLIDFDFEMAKQKRKIALILDNAPSHKVAANLTNIKLIFIPPNMTAHLQPLDAGIINALKCGYKKMLINLALDCYEKKISFNIDLRKVAVELSEIWHNLSSNTISNCFGHCKIKKNFQDVILNENFDNILTDMAKYYDKTGEPTISLTEYLNAENDIDNEANIGSIDEIIQLSLYENDETIADESPSPDDHTEEPKVSCSEALASIDKLITFFGQQEYATVEDVNKVFQLKNKVRIINRKLSKQMRITDFLNEL